MSFLSYETKICRFSFSQEYSGKIRFFEPRKSLPLLNFHKIGKRQFSFKPSPPNLLETSILPVEGKQLNIYSKEDTKGFFLSNSNYSLDEI